MTEDGHVTEGDDTRSTAAVLDFADSFDDFFRREHANIVTALSLALRDDHFGRDAAAEGFTRALQKWKQVSSYDNATGWVYRVGLNWARSRRRRSRREVSNDAVLDATSAPAVAYFEPRLGPAMSRLSIDHRAVVVAKYWFDWSEQTTADALSIRPGTVKSRLSRAHEQLAADLGSA